uniref:Macro domain-containing protein n=1 Tax=Bursaphelenchus xylophilus TaxID=6326 RepID=A0A1I7RXG4_BURXY
MPNSSPAKRTPSRKSRNSESQNPQETPASAEAVQQSSSQSQGSEPDGPSIRRSARPPKRNTLLLEAFEEAQTSSSRQKRPRQDSANETVPQPDSKSKENSPFKSPAKKPRTSNKRSRLSETEAQKVVDHEQSVDQAPEVPKSPRRKAVQSQAAPAKIPQIRVEPAESQEQEQPPDVHHDHVESQKDHENRQNQDVGGEFDKGAAHVQEEVVTVSMDDMQYVDEHGQPVQIKDGIIVEKDQEGYEYEVIEEAAEPRADSEIQVRRTHQESMSTMLESLFYSKLNIYERTFTTSNADVAINICTPDITDGYMFFDEIHALAGPRLIRDCKNYVGMQNGSCRVTRSYNAGNYKCIIHTALPHLPTTTRIVDVEIAQLAIKRCLNEAVARGAQTIAFPSFFPCFSPLVSAEFLLKVISNWMYLTDQKGQVNFVEIFG